ncbi:hypothetical protein KIW84_042553 [Lathyrus oleraceus]|uniref:Uncharacterized protein n=1 Tax=Pisum sativum TaxID=3888 RepID=A0A9D4XCU1_PEA|nr:hypothetical protein KIW84_042553 [Pisum sativum]
MSYNNFSGEIPLTVHHLPHLLTLRLAENQFSGLIPELNPPDLQDFNVSGNRLSGEIPRTLSTFSESSFRQNLFLCGAPLEKCKAEPNKPGSEDEHVGMSFVDFNCKMFLLGCIDEHYEVAAQKP